MFWRKKQRDFWVKVEYRPRLNIFDRNPRVAVITFSRPPVNALSLALQNEIHKAVQSVPHDGNVRCIFLRAEGNGFSGGGDLRELLEAIKGGEKTIIPFLQEGQEFMNAIAKNPVPVVAVIHGYALGGGCELALACRVRYALPYTRIGLTQVRFDILPGWGGTSRLTHLIGDSLAHDLIAKGIVLSVEDIESDARLRHLILRVVPSFHDALEDVKMRFRTNYLEAYVKRILWNNCPIVQTQAMMVSERKAFLRQVKRANPQERIKTFLHQKASS